MSDVLIGWKVKCITDLIDDWNFAKAAAGVLRLSTETGTPENLEALKKLRRFRRNPRLLSAIEDKLQFVPPVVRTTVVSTLAMNGW